MKPTHTQAKDNPDDFYDFIFFIFHCVFWTAIQPSWYRLHPHLISSHERMSIHSCRHLINIHRMPSFPSIQVLVLFTHPSPYSLSRPSGIDQHTLCPVMRKTLYASPVKPHACICNVYQDPAKPKVAPTLRERKNRRDKPTQPGPDRSQMHRKLNTQTKYIIHPFERVISHRLSRD